MDYIIGIDGGGTKTVGLLTTTDGEEIAKVKSGPSNYHVVGVENTQKVLAEVTSQLTTHAGNTKLHSINFCIGMAGLGREEDRERIGGICDEIGVSKNRILTHDAHIALVGGIARQEGIIVISGTGSIVFGIDGLGKEARAGGWGYILGDEGSGYDIAIKGLQAIARAADRRESPTQITELVLNELELKGPNDIIRWTHAADRDEIAQLAKYVFLASEKGDKKADGIIDAAVTELVSAVETVVKQLELSHPSEIVFSGGNLLYQPILSNRLRRSIEKNIDGTSVVLPKHEPAYGAVLLAMANL